MNTGCLWTCGTRHGFPQRSYLSICRFIWRSVCLSFYIPVFLYWSIYVLRSVSLSLCLSFYMSISLSVCMYVCMLHVYMPVYMPVYIPVYKPVLYICLSKHPSFCLTLSVDIQVYCVRWSASQWVCLSVCLSACSISLCMSICLSICLSVCLYVYLYVYMSLYLSFCCQSVVSLFSVCCQYDSQSVSLSGPLHLFVANLAFGLF